MGYYSVMVALISSVSGAGTLFWLQWFHWTVWLYTPCIPFNFLLWIGDRWPGFARFVHTTHLVWLCVLCLTYLRIGPMISTWRVMCRAYVHSDLFRFSCQEKQDEGWMNEEIGACGCNYCLYPTSCGFIIDLEDAVYSCLLVLGNKITTMVRIHGNKDFWGALSHMNNK